MATLHDVPTTSSRVIDRFPSFLRERLSSLNALVPRDALVDPEVEQEMAPAGEDVAEVQAVDPVSWPASMETVLEQFTDLPQYSVLFGLGEDELPFVLDLSDPAPGAILISGDVGCGKSRLLRSVLASAVQLNQAHRMAFNLLAQDADEFSALVESEHCHEAMLAVDPGVSDVIEDLFLIVEDRRRRRIQDPAIILAIDNLAACLRFLDAGSFSRLMGLVKHGPRYRVWPIATLPAGLASEVDPRLLAAFRTRLVGYIADPGLTEYLSGDSGLDTGELYEGGSFFVPLGDEWLRFWVCDPQEG